MSVNRIGEVLLGKVVNAPMNYKRSLMYNPTAPMVRTELAIYLTWARVETSSKSKPMTRQRDEGIDSRHLALSFGPNDLILELILSTLADFDLLLEILTNFPLQSLRVRDHDRVVKYDGVAIDQKATNEFRDRLDRDTNTTPNYGMNDSDSADGECAPPFDVVYDR